MKYIGGVKGTYSGEAWRSESSGKYYHAENGHGTWWSNNGHQTYIGYWLKSEFDGYGVWEDLSDTSQRGRYIGECYGYIENKRVRGTMYFGDGRIENVTNG